METVRIKIIKEVVKCENCKRAKDFLYLSDFAYGQRLVYLNDATEYAYANLIEDKYFQDYIKIVKTILREKKIVYTNETLNDFVNELYGITCDTINGNNVDFSQDQNKCLYCGSTEFEKYMSEPEALVEMEIPLISHVVWENLSENRRRKLIEEKMKECKIISGSQWSNESRRAGLS